jgi:hypothetical protein
MKRKTIFSCGLIAVAAFSVALIQTNVLRAQSLWSVPVGGTASTLSHLGPVSGEDKYRGMDVYRWMLSNGNQFTATVNPEGEIVYAESDWFGKSAETGCDLAGLKFGVTTLAELRKRFGSDGFTFRTRASGFRTEDGLAMMYSWEVDKVVITFYTKINSQDLAQTQAEGSKESTADYAKLYAISMANAAYARREWGARLDAPVTTKTVWK